MKKVIISVFGGIADIQENKENVNVIIVDHDNGDEVPQTTYDSVVIEVFRGVADCTYSPDDVEVEIVDYD